MSSGFGPRVYVAGPFRGKTPWIIEENIRRAESLGLRVARMGAVPVIPHSMYRFYQDSLPDDFWLAAGLSILSTCDALACVLPHDKIHLSQGTTAEVAFHIKAGRPVFYDEVVGIGGPLPVDHVRDSRGAAVRTVEDSGRDGCMGLRHFIEGWRLDISSAYPHLMSLPNKEDPWPGMPVCYEGPRLCTGCGRPLLLENLFVCDGCPCNEATHNFEARACAVCGEPCSRPGHHLRSVYPGVAQHLEVQRAVDSTPRREEQK